MSFTDLLVTLLSLSLSGLILLKTKLGKAIFRRFRANAPRTSPLAMGLILGISVFVAHLSVGSLMRSRMSSALPVPHALVLSVGVGAIAYFGCRQTDHEEHGLSRSASSARKLHRDKMES